LKKQRFINKFVDLIMATRDGWSDFEDVDESEQQALESPLVGSEQPETFYSVVLMLKDLRILDVKRIEHCHLCGGQGSDSYVRRFRSNLHQGDCQNSTRQAHPESTD
jgi:hypothetical protein